MTNDFRQAKFIVLKKNCDVHLDSRQIYLQEAENRITERLKVQSVLVTQAGACH